MADIASVQELAANPQIITATATDPIGYSTSDLANLYTTTSDNYPEDLTYSSGHRLVCLAARRRGDLRPRV